MPFLQAVFCLKGFDDRSRFLASSMFALLGFIFCSVIFSGYLVVVFALLLILTTVLICSTKRRLHDAKLNKNWQLVPAGLFLLTGILSLIIESSSSFYLLILPALSSALLLTYPSKNKKNQDKYILGYYGPVDLSIYQQEPVGMTTHHQRIEPTLAAACTSEQLYINETATEQSSAPIYNSDDENNSKQVDIGELIRLKLFSNRKLQLGVIASISLIFIAVFVNSVLNSINLQHLSPSKTELSELQDPPKNSSGKNIANKNHLLEMPDNFNLYLSEYQGIIIHWQADRVPDGELWSLLSANGDKSCQNIKFNKGAPLRSLTVLVENGSEYFASFSPLDSQELVQALAFRGKFSLCGYSFSLKGSQAVLGKHNQYAPFLDKDA